MVLTDLSKRSLSVKEGVFCMRTPALQPGHLCSERLTEPEAYAPVSLSGGDVQPHIHPGFRLDGDPKSSTYRRKRRPVVTGVDGIHDRGDPREAHQPEPVHEIPSVFPLESEHVVGPEFAHGVSPQVDLPDNELLVEGHIPDTDSREGA